MANITSSNRIINGENSLEKFLTYHSYQLSSSGVPEYLWPTIEEKINDEIYDAGEYFQMCQVREEAEDDSSESDVTWKVIVTHPEGLKVSCPNNIFLIDHAWTYQAKDAKTALEECDGLLERMCNLMNIKMPNEGKETLITKVLHEMWKFNAPYTFSLHSGDGTKNIPAEDKLAMWYILDEFGSRIQHDGDPNFRVIPFYYLPRKCCYSLLFPIKDVEEGEEVTRNYVESPPVDDLIRDAQMLPWFPVDLTHLDYEQPEPPLEFFTERRHRERVPEHPVTELPLPTDRKIKVYTDYEYIRDYLTDSRFEIVEDREEADIIWISTHWQDFRSLANTPHKRISQFPFESLLTIKDLLAIVSRRGLTSQDCSSQTSQLHWYIPAFCLQRELPAFVAHYQKREKRGLDNTWIVKPWNLGRGLEITITDNLNHILRLPSTGPKIAQKYLHNPVLFFREDINVKVKFDLRFIVLLLNVKPLKVAVYKNFWIRFANKGFDLSDLHDEQKHLTVNNYNDSFLLQMFCEDFIKKFEAQYPSHPWSNLREKIYAMIKELFEKATCFDGPRGIAHNPQCRGSYGLDIMVDWAQNGKDEVMVPKLLEVNFNSDCKRACEYYPKFFNDLFKVMFLDDTSCDTVEFL